MHVPRVIYYFDMTSSPAPTTFVISLFPRLSLAVWPTLFSIFPSTDAIAMDDMEPELARKKKPPSRISLSEQWQWGGSAERIYEHEHELKMRARQATRTLTMMAKGEQCKQKYPSLKKDIVNGKK